MGRILVNWRITFASLFSVLLIASAYLLARSIESPPIAQASTETALLQAIAAKDSDNDGLPDWEEVLYGTNANATDSFQLGMTDGEAVAKGLVVPKAIADIPAAPSTAITVGTDGLPPPPAEGTLTAAFAQSFFTLYMEAKQSVGGADLTDTQIRDIANKALSTLAASVAPATEYKKAADLSVSGSGAAALTMFSADAERLLRKNSNNATTTELVYLKNAQNGDTTAFAYLSAIAKSYRDSAVGLSALSVPRELVAADLELVNALMRMSKIISDFTLVNADPLTAILALTQYPLVMQDLAKAFTDIGSVYAVAGVHLPAGTPGAAFVNLMADVPSTRAKPQL